MRKALFFFGILSDSDIEWMVATGTREQVSAGTTLIHEGKDLPVIYIVLDGTLVVSTARMPGRKIAQLRAGELVGEMSFVDSRPPSATVVAVEDSVVLTLPRSSLEERLKEVEFAARFYRALAVFLADRLRGTVSRFGYGNPDAAAEAASEEELNPVVLDMVAIAGARFDQLMRRLRRD